jgi:hypothetical protein
MTLLAASALSADAVQQAHLLSLVNIDGKETIVLSTIPAADAKDQSIQTRTVFSEQNLSYYKVCGVYGGHLIILKPPFELLAIDVTTGSKKLISQTACENAILVGGHLYYVVAIGKSTKDETSTHALHTMDLESGVQRELCLLTGSRSGMMQIGSDFTFAATADGSKVAVTEVIPDENLQHHCRIVVVDSRTADVTRSPPNFASRSVLTGASHWLLAPKCFGTTIKLY